MRHAQCTWQQAGQDACIVRTVMHAKGGRQNAAAAAANEVSATSGQGSIRMCYASKYRLLQEICCRKFSKPCETTCQASSGLQPCARPQHSVLSHSVLVQPSRKEEHTWPLVWGCEFRRHIRRAAGVAGRCPCGHHIRTPHMLHTSPLAQRRSWEPCAWQQTHQLS